TTGKPEGDVYELWVGGEHEGKDAADVDENGNVVIMEKDISRFATGYGVIKYYLGQEYYGKYTQWVYLSYDEMLLMYAECLAQCGRLEEAIAKVDEVRARVGLKGLKYGQAAYKGNKSTLSDLSTKEGVLAEILRERACELGMSNNRYYDMIRYKRTDWMTKRLHGIVTFRMMQNSKKEWNRSIRPYIGDDKNNRVQEPYCFTYQKFELQNRARYLWDYNPSDLEVKKWLLMPMPLSEINKNYGLVQNPGW
ncbi:MAG: RagB/SusD family nutrient uptake outer membrane protein, partial [Prevotella sp.]|nr:RagB/SusD family nutrient uptake outer membrane protein [Prevotella sp.]